MRRKNKPFFRSRAASARIDLDRMILAALLLLLGFLAAMSQAHATVFGLKSCGSGSVNSSACFNGEVTGGGSMAPTVLFSFTEAGVLSATQPVVTDEGQEIHADALAINATNTLFAYELTTTLSTTNPLVADVTASRLVTLNPATGAVISPIGSALVGRDVRGAAFGPGGHLWAVDATQDQLIRVNPASGGIDGAVGLTFGGGAFDLSTSSDIALQPDGTAILVDLGAFYQLDLATGVLSALFSNGLQFAGLAFSDAAAADLLFAYEVGGQEDIFTYDLANANAQSQIITNLIPTLGGQLFNAGRGDLAARVTFVTAVPEPGTLVLFAVALAGFGFVRRRHLTA